MPEKSHVWPVNHMERFFDLAILPVVLTYLLLIGAFVIGVFLIVKVRRELDLLDGGL
jgi:hypothetical protein